MDLRTNINLTHLNLNNNRITAIDTSKNTKLQRLWLYGNRLARICLCVSENVDEQTYINHNFFDLSNQ